MKKLGFLALGFVLNVGWAFSSHGETCLDFLKDLKPTSAAIKPAAERVDKVLDYFTTDVHTNRPMRIIYRNLAYREEVKQIQSLVPLDTLRENRIPKIVGTEVELTHTLEAADQLLAKTKHYRKKLPELTTFAEDLRLLLASRFVDLRSVDPKKFDSLRDLHRIAYLEQISPEPLSELKLSPSEALATNAKIKKALESEQELWGDTILEGDYFLKGNAIAESVLVYRAGDAILGYRLAIAAKARDGEGGHGSIRVAKFYDRDLNEIYDHSFLAEFEEEVNE